MVSDRWLPSQMPEDTVRRNRLLRGLPKVEAAVAQELLEPVKLRYGQTLQDAGEPLPYVYFPADSLLSTTIALDDGSSVEYGSIGCDGVFGNRFMAHLRAPGRALCQVPGEAYRVRPKVLFERAAEMPVLRDLMYRYSQFLYVTTAQLVACNCLHSVTQRCARWLLSTRDALGRDEFELTQEYLATMLGVRRASVTGAIGKLASTGCVKYRRGCVTIVRARGLEKSACECYRVMVENRKLVSAP
jgi:CRP-like cAMP-binding protein